MNTIKNKLVALAAMLAIATSAAVAAPKATDQKGDQPVAEQVRHQLLKLPYYGIFDNLAYKVEGGTVTLYGQVVRPITRSDAATVVKRIKGVEQVINNIDVLPASSFDDAIRARTVRELYRMGSLYRYTRGVHPSLHIIVRGGHVTLEGVVATKTDKQLAYLAASRVPGVFSVTNNLRAERGESVAY
ncbi:MAG TPA: BON domain-containing protein [Pyrinomonadaceae bacterium]